MSTLNSRALSVVAALALLIQVQPALGLSQHDKRWAEVQKKGTDALDANQYWLAEPLLKEAVVQAGSFGMKDLRLAKALGELGRMYTIRSRFKEAEPFLEEELQIKKSVLGVETEGVLPCMGNLINFYLSYGTTSKAKPLTNEVLAIVEGKLSENLNGGSSDGKVVFKKGQTLEGWAGEAAPVMRDPLLDWAITCDNLGTIYQRRGEFDLAERLFKAALDTKTIILGKEHLSLANSYDSLGTLAAERGDNADAETFLKDAIAQTERIVPDSPSLYSRMDKLAKCYAKQGKYSQAAELYHKALEHFRKEPSKAGDDARAYFALGCLYVQQKHYSQAAPVLHHALELATEYSGPDSIALVPYLQKYAYTMYYLGRKGDNVHLNGRANNIAGDVH